MWDVIEHVSRPSSELAKTMSMLKPGGMVVVHTMDIDSLIAKVMGSRWPWLMDMHIHYFGRKTLTKMLEDNGYEVIWVGAQGRYLSLGYVASRIGGNSQPIGRFCSWIVEKLSLAEMTVPINLGDLMTAFARKPFS